MLEQLYAIVNTRYEDERAMTITTNLDRDELARADHARTVSRLEEMCERAPRRAARIARRCRLDVRPACRRPPCAMPAS